MSKKKLSNVTPASFLFCLVTSSYFSIFLSSCYFKAHLVCAATLLCILLICLSLCVSLSDCLYSLISLSLCASLTVYFTRWTFWSLCISVSPWLFVLLILKLTQAVKKQKSPLNRYPNVKTCVSYCVAMF